MLLKKLAKKNLISPPKFLISNTIFLTQMGSVAYGVAGETSDWDCYGVCVPHKTDIFPHLKGEIPGFGRQKKRFDTWQQHHIKDETTGREYDFQIYSIIKYFHLMMENNPNIIDSLFVPRRCILHTTPISELIRENRHIFLHKGCYHKLKGYAYSQMHKMETKDPKGKRKEIRDKYGADVKFIYHVYRLISECEQILTECTLVLDEVGRRETMKAIRRGEWSLERIKEHFEQKEKDLEQLYAKSELPYSPDETKIKDLLIECLRMHFGNLEGAVVIEDKAMNALRKIKEAIEEAGL
mgnify:CR=1 FL=1